jgi:hypothetical protein
MAGAFAIFKAAEFTASVISSFTTIKDAIVATSVAAGDAAKVIGIPGAVGEGTLLGALGGIVPVVAGVLVAVHDLIASTSKDPTLNKLADLQAQRGTQQEAYTQKKELLTERFQAGAISDVDYVKQLKELDDQYQKQSKALEGNIKQTDAVAHANKSLSASTDLLQKTFKQTEDASKKLSGNDFKHLTAATEAATQSMMTMSQSMMAFGAMGGFGGMGGGGMGGGVSGAHFTEYGPAVAGDQPGQSTYDWNSYHHVGAWPGVTGPLRAGDVALGYGAQAKYHVSPGQMFSDEYGRTWRFADRSGSKDPFNVDVFHGALGGIFRKPTRALIGESGPEAVVPLHGAGAAMAGLGGPSTINVNVAGHAEDPEAIARAVERVLREHYRRSAVV